MQGAVRRQTQTGRRRIATRVRVAPDVLVAPVRGQHGGRRPEEFSVPTPTVGGCRRPALREPFWRAFSFIEVSVHLPYSGPYVLKTRCHL